MSQAAPTILSPKIQALADAADGVALEAFWSERAVEGTPIVEPNGDDADSRLVTFVWRADGPLENIVLAEWYSPGEPAAKVMTQLGDTDLWYRTLVMRSNLRGVYQFLTNDSLLPVRTDPNIMERLGRLQRDPLNPKRALPEPMWGIVSPSWGDDSVIELPDAPPMSGHAIRYDVPRGAITERIFS
ncbi:MAG: enterochelin esterase domain-containing protein, partial [Thermomicrobiales bacterium]